MLPTRPDGTEPVLLSLESEQGPVAVFDENGKRLALIRPGGPAEDVRGLPLRVTSVLPASGLLLKRDPGVPLVYLGFAVTLLGGGLSLIATRQLWAISEAGKLHVGGLCPDASPLPQPDGDHRPDSASDGVCHGRSAVLPRRRHLQYGTRDGCSVHQRDQYSRGLVERLL